MASTAAFLLVNQANNWVAALHPTFSQAQVNTEVGNEIGIPFPTITALQNGFNNGTISSTNDVESKGTEIELNYNPTRFWTLTANATDTKVINSNVSGDVQAWLNQRLPIWTTIVDPRTNTLWWTTNYTGSQTASANYQSFVASPFLIIQQTAGKRQTQFPRYNFRLSTNFQLAGITDNPILKHFNVTGAIRWQAAQSIGYYGVQSLPATITALDINKPIYYGAQAFFDAGVGYARRGSSAARFRCRFSSTPATSSAWATSWQPIADFPGRHAQLVPHPRSDPVHPAGVVRPVTTAEIDPLVTRRRSLTGAAFLSACGAVPGRAMHNMPLGHVFSTPPADRFPADRRDRRRPGGSRPGRPHGARSGRRHSGRGRLGDAGARPEILRRAVRHRAHRPLALRGRLRHAGLLFRQHGGRHPDQLQAGGPRRRHFGRDPAADGRLRDAGYQRHLPLHAQRDGHRHLHGQHRGPQRQRQRQQPAEPDAAANRASGASPLANIARDNFESIGRVPIDPIAIDSVEISRGPNGQRLRPRQRLRHRQQRRRPGQPLPELHPWVAFRTDSSTDGSRISLDANRALTSQLAIRISGVFQHDGFVRKPSGINEERYNAMIQYKPFKWTTVTASYSYFRSNGNRPNDTLPRDSVSYWASQGKPAWDPVTQTIHVNGTTIGPITAATFPTSFSGVNTDYFNNSFTGNNHGYAFIDQTGLGYWSAPNTFNTASGPVTNNQVDRFMAPSAGAGIVSGKPANQPLFSTTPSVATKTIYDYSSVNLASVNRQTDRDLTTEISLDQIALETPLQQLAFNASFYREDTQRYTRNIIGIANDNGQSGQLMVDVNSRLLDGTPNPYFLRPYIGQDMPRTVQAPAKWDTYRLQMAYKLDFTTKKDSWMKWLGLHQLSAYDDYKYRISRQYSFRDVITDAHSWIPAGLNRGNNAAIVGGPPAALAITRDYFRYYVGNANGTGQVNYAPSDFAYGSYPFVWGNSATGVFNHEQSVIGPGATTDATGGGANSKVILKSLGVVVQSHFLNDDLVTTLGKREDKHYQKSGSVPQLINPDGVTFNYASLNGWAPGDYKFNTGMTTQNGAVFRPFKDFTFVHDLARQDSPVGRFLGQLLGGLSLSRNQSNSFQPANFATNDFLQPLPNPSGNSLDYGLGLNLFGGKFVANVRRYDTRQVNARGGDASTIAQRALRSDIASTATFLLAAQANNWVAALNPAFNQTQVNTEVGREMGLDFGTITALQNAFNANTIASTNDIGSKGTEVELHYNPTRFWTLTANATVTEVINSNVSQDVSAWIAGRLPVWTTIIDPRTNDLWWNHNYGGSNAIASANYQSFVASPFEIIQQQQGKSNPQNPRYNFRMSTNVQLAGLTDNPLLKHFNVSAAVRWQAPQAIGYYGVQQLPATITALDKNKPIYNPAQAYYDGGIGYRGRLFANKVPVTVQLNVRNLQEGGGHLQPAGTFPDGTFSTYRIVDPRLYILQVSFDL